MNLHRSRAHQMFTERALNPSCSGIGPLKWTPFPLSAHFDHALTLTVPSGSIHMKEFFFLFIFF